MPSSGRSSRLRWRSFRYASTGARLSSESSEWRWRSRITTALSPEYDVDAGEDQIDLPARQTTDTAGQERSVERQDLGDIGDRVLWQPGASRPKALPGACAQWRLLVSIPDVSRRPELGQRDLRRHVLEPHLDGEADADGVRRA